MHERIGQLPREEQEHLLNDCRDWTEMADRSSSSKDLSFTHTETVRQIRTEESSVPSQSLEGGIHDTPRPAQGGPRLALIASSLLVLVGNWTRYAGTRASPPNFGATMFGQILIGLAQPFVLSAPTRFSDLWFSPRGRVSATAIASLANPFGGALGQLINPFLASHPKDIAPMTLYIAVISSVAAIPSLFIPAKPPTPSSASSTHTPPGLRKSLGLLCHNPNFVLLLLPFAVYVGFFNSLSSLLTQILTPYNFSETESGVAGALLILVGLVAAAVTSPMIDRSKKYLLLIKCLVPVIAICDLAFIWTPGTRSVAAPYVILSVLGAASFSLVPVALEWAAEITWPVGPEAASTICWTGGQLLGGIFIVISDALKEEDGEGEPKGNMGKALIFQAVVACVFVPCALMLGRVGGGARNKRLEVDKAASDANMER
ncbi:MAG: hypothetical protein LQ342_003295 [Letrouitia transgressa]|nr:MAG: hypothetical protein LQ342_003295 [Letrouitia transgressa]